MKFVIIIVLAAMVGGGLWAAGVSLFGGSANVPAEATVAVAKVNGQTISLYDLYLTYLRYAQQIEAQQGPLSDRSHEALRYQALEALVDSVLVNQELTKLKISASKAEVDEQMKQIVELFPSEEDFKVQLNAAGLTEAGLRNQLEHQIKLDKLQQEIGSPRGK